MKRVLLAFVVLVFAAASSAAGGHGGGAHGGGGHTSGGEGGHFAGGGRGASGSGNSGGWGQVTGGGSRSSTRASRSSAATRGVAAGGIRGTSLGRGKSSGGGFHAFPFGASSDFQSGSFLPRATRVSRGIGVIRGSTARRGVGSGDAPPNYSKPGALIRTEGQLPVYSDPGNARTHAVDGGGFIGEAPRGAPSACAGGNGVTENTPGAPADVPAFDPSF